MSTFEAGYRSLSLLVNLTWDRLFYIISVFLALMAGAYLVSLF
ncbi:hypothetical protein Ga0609869_002253 [Rhodovulum iodosum]|uniref:Uncharacterized protein n=1 Tax=Rhodovulum iodosum TaxID=68291 RepID=A0ABV3XU89_9RHOB|nr:hypothetical protein [Rhodovulum robiginosum]